MSDSFNTLRGAVQQAATRIGELQQERARLQGELATREDEIYRLRGELESLGQRLRAETTELACLQGYARERQQIRERLNRLLARLDALR